MAASAYALSLIHIWNFRGLDEHYYRIAVRTMKENEYLIDCLKKISPETKET